MTPFEDLPLLRAFVRVVESGSISAAARTLGVTQPTLSRQLQTLEERSGAQLLLRDTHRMSLTPSGRQVLDDARSLLALAEDAAQRLKTDQTGLRGHIRLFATIDFGQSVVSRLLASFIQANPGVTADLAYSNRPVHMIEEGRDVGIVAGEMADDAVVARRLGRMRRWVAASPALVNSRRPAAGPAELAEWPWLNLAGAQFDGGRSVTLCGDGREERIPLQPVMISEGVTSLREAARMGLGVAVLPEWLIAEDLASGALVRVLEGWRGRDLAAYVVYPVQRRVPKRVRAFIDFAADYVGALLFPGAD
ncbi:MAG: LysR family transcriptional regulator [Acidobacteria bacterium]|nr:LysR family transcriptional regulator [Acidobacteriota bacterium]